jgi:hypothetical protein
VELDDLTMILTDLHYAREQLARAAQCADERGAYRAWDSARRADDALERIESRVKAAAGI